MNSKQQTKAPVPLENHYEIFKNIEAIVHQRLLSLEHEYFVIGLRVAYDEVDSSNEPGILPYTIEFGQLGPVDIPAQCVENEELDEANLHEAVKNSPIPLEFLDELHAYSMKELQAAANIKLSVGVAVVLTGSPTLGYSVSCPCGTRTARTKRYCYYDRRTGTTRCYCTKRGC